MPKCKWCGEKGFFLSLSNNGLCKSCDFMIVTDFKARERVMVESTRLINSSKNPQTRLTRINVMREHLTALLKYEEKDITTTVPSPSELLKKLDEMEETISKES